MNNVSPGPALRDLVVACLPSTLALPVLVAVLDGDLPRLAAINKIMTAMKETDALNAVAEMNASMRLLGLRQAGGEDHFWFCFDALPLGSYNRRPGTLSLFVRSAEDNLYVLSPGARSFGSGAVENVGQCLKFANGGKSLKSLDATQVLDEIRATLVQRLNQVDWNHFW